MQTSVLMYLSFVCQISMKQSITNLDLLVRPTKFLLLHVASWTTTKYHPQHGPIFPLGMKLDTWKCILQASYQIRLGFYELYIISTFDT